MRPHNDITEPLAGNERFGPFILVEEIKRGGMGRLHLARTPWPDAPVAIVKSLPTGRQSSFVSVERFRHEAELAVRLVHPNLAATHHVGRVRDALYVAVEPVFGRDALDVAKRSKKHGVKVPPEVALPIIRDILRALAYIHALPIGPDRPPGILHRDVTPGNVVVGYDGITKLVDFGIAKSALTERYDLTRDFVIGTPSYLAPEVVLGEAPTPSVDIYGAGAVAYRLLTQTPPFSGSGADVLVRAISERPRPLDDLRPDLPTALVLLVERMMAGNVAQRFQTAVSALEALDSIAEPRAYADYLAVSQWMRALYGADQQADEARIERIRAMPYPEDSAWTSSAKRFVHDEIQPTISAGDVETDLELSKADVLAASVPVEEDETIRPPVVDDEFVETVAPPPHPPSTDNWHIAREPEEAPPKPTVVLPPNEASPAPVGPKATSFPLTVTQVLVVVAIASIVSGVLGAVIGLYFAGR